MKVLKGFPIGLMVVLTAAGSTSAAAQGLVEAHERGSFGAAAILARPVGEFQQFVDFGGGLNLFGVLELAPGSGFGVRVDGTFLMYGSETRAVPFSQTIPSILLDLTTTNSIVSAGIGPQFTVGHGRMRAYAYGLAGFSYFTTVTSIRDVDGFESIAQTTNFDYTTFALSGGGGLRLQLSRGAKPVHLDLGVVAVQNGDAEYLREGSIREAADGSVFYTPIRSQANLVNFKLGMAVSLF